MTSWKPLLCDDRYEASDDGRIRRINGAEVKPNGNDKRHYYVDLPRCPPQSVHRLVYSAFHGEPTKGMYVKHRNGNTFDNRLSNLQLMTPRESTQHNLALGIHNNKLDESIARMIKRDLRLGRPRKEIVASYAKVTYDDIDNIVRGRAWAYVEG